MPGGLVCPSTPETELQRKRKIGLNVPDLTFTVSFHSGSYFELVCKDISVKVLD